MGNVTAKKAGTAIITATSENGVSASCTITVNKRDTYTGLRDVNGELTYFNNGNVDTTYTGLVDYEDSTYYVRNGVVDITYTGFADYEDDRYYISEGVVDTNIQVLFRMAMTGYMLKMARLIPIIQDLLITMMCGSI